MPTTCTGADIARSALIIVDMQNDFLHPEGGFAQRACANPEALIDLPFLIGTIPQAKCLVESFRAAGRPVVYVTHVLKSDYSDAQFPYWRVSRGSLAGNRTFIAEGTWGAQVIDELKPRDNEHVVKKKGYGGFSNTPLDTILRNLDVNTCVVCGVTTCVCVSTTVRGGVEHNYRMIVVKDAVAEIHRDTHEAELKTMARAFADVKSTAEVVEMLAKVETSA
ncbi:MAG: cysteine hydrolase [Candidatus Korobacteraceae bacterium]